jgi:hypothetical protein
MLANPYRFAQGDQGGQVEKTAGAWPGGQTRFFYFSTAVELFVNTYLTAVSYTQLTLPTT